MPSSIPHQKFCFYHLPTRGRAGIKLGDARYVSNVSIIFYCSMLLYYLFWMIMGLFYTFILFLGLTYKPEAQPKLMFFAYFSVSKERNIKWSPNGLKPSGTWFLNKRDPEDLESTSRNQRGEHEAGGRAYPLGVPSTLVGPMLLHRRTSSSYISIHTPKTSREPTKHNFHRLFIPPL